MISTGYFGVRVKPYIRLSPASGAGTPGDDYRASGVFYRVEATTDLQSGSWLPAATFPGLSAEAATTPYGDDTESVQINYTVSSNLPRVFPRLNVSLVP